MKIQGRDLEICAGVPEIFIGPPSRILSFPGVKVGQSSTKGIEVSNRGTGDLKVKSVKVSGARNDRLEIFSNDPEEGVISIKLFGEGK